MGLGSEVMDVADAAREGVEEVWDGRGYEEIVR